ncbi:MAG TPA: Hpt domain-containing protein, partial [Candidatus Nanopelagicales bacterium]|nr:Hpt domain-containing protein [Candidatus Nanopelagicales bacterium]
MVDAGDRARDEFFSEAQEIIEGLGRDLLALDEAVRANRVDPDLINDIFRAVHTLKGLAGLFGANRMATLSHELEDLLDNLRLGRVDVSPVVLVILFRSVELYGRILQVEKSSSDEPIPEVEELLRDLHRGFGQREAPSVASEYDLDPGLLAVLTEYEEHRLRTNIQSGLTLYRIRVHFQLATIDHALDELKVTAKPFGEIITYLPTGTGADADSIELDILMASRAPVDELRRALGDTGAEVEEIPRRHGGAAGGGGSAGVSGHPAGGAGLSSSVPAPSGPISPRIRPGEPSSVLPPPSSSGGARKKRGAELGSIRSVAQTVRVDINKLDRLMNTVGELALVRSSLRTIVERLRANPAERELSQKLVDMKRDFDRHLEAIQKGILEVRMVPLGQ